jgi:rhamnosyltransferase
MDIQQENETQHVFLVGAKSLGAYGGYETFVYKLTEYHQDNRKIKYHVACKANGDGCMDETAQEGVTSISGSEFEFHNAHCFKISVPQIGAAQAIYYDMAALKECCRYIEEYRIQHPIVYIMACRIGPFAGYFYRKIHRLGGRVYLNPDGHEWLRAKWNRPIREYWKLSEQMMVRYSDLVICDSVNIEKYIRQRYGGKGMKGRNLKTTFIAYGADFTSSRLKDTDSKLVDWYREKGLKKKDYYLVVGRFVPENSFEIMIREFMESESEHDFALVTNVNDKFLDKLEQKLHFKNDKRIKFVGTVYDQELLKKIRENAYAYLHGHTVGGTNPSLIEALGSTDLNLLVDVEFNREVAKECALYWNDKPGNLADLIDTTDGMRTDLIVEMGAMAKKRVAKEYTWDKICRMYEDIFVEK